MDWLQRINESINYMETHLMEELSIEQISNYVFASKSNFQRVFHMVTGVTIGEYIRNRRLSLAGQDLLLTDNKVADIAQKYRYDTSESFSKAFLRFHSISPSDVKTSGAVLRFFHPLSINISIRGGFNRAYQQIDEFCWNNLDEQIIKTLTDAEKYQELVHWAITARGKNPGVFDALTEWLLDDIEWCEDKLNEYEQILMQGVFARFSEQNKQLRRYLSELRPAGVVNEAVFKALDQFNDQLSGQVPDERLQKVVAQVLDDFSLMKQRGIREQIAGSITGPTGTDHADIYGFINYLKECDAEVQWALFMPDKVKRQQNGFKVVNYEYKEMPGMRFIGWEDDDLTDSELQGERFRVLDAMNGDPSGFDYDILLSHHEGLSIDVEPVHLFWGRFMRADTPVPKGFLSFDFLPYHDGRAGIPYISQFAYAEFSGDYDAMHKTEGYDISAMYDVTRNIMLSQGITIPYPDKYWTAEVFKNGYDKGSTAYMFSAELIDT